ncbi:PTS mannitol transporter subunit IICB [Xylocopilactobacillus apicola]|uniref:PTS system mannitol-specific EIICB component n=1 Tax=Xylocopilactobacillus apicola TaxID=2932184 RepID=A0AAU9DKI0_9LACO|nr:PTS mannitol transporter subunit IICB [Xylocopilactobacillus apicola]BDR59056.1 PTS mannitol transporter subunit IICB [Xylocopilactobacillus apicola]
MENTTTETSRSSARVKVQKFGSFLSSMVMPNIGAFIAWGLITAIFLYPNGWLPNEQIASLIGPMKIYLLPMLLAYTGGQLVDETRGAVTASIATMGLIVGGGVALNGALDKATPMFIGAMAMGPLAGWCIKKFDEWVDGKIKRGFEMLVNNFSIGIIGMLLAIVGFYAIAPIMNYATNVLKGGIDWLIQRNLIPLMNIIIEPAKVLFLNNAINQGIMTPIGIQQAAGSAGKSILFLLEPDPGPGLGVLLAYALFGKGEAKASAPSAIIIHFLGGIHEIYFPYILMKPALILATIAGGVTGTLTFSILHVGLQAPPSPGSIISILLMSTKDPANYLGIILGVALATVVSFLISAIILKRDKSGNQDLAASTAAMNQMKSQGSTSSTVAAEPSEYKDIDKIIFACDAGMGSSAMGASLLRDKVKKAGIEMSVTNVAISKLKDEPGQLVVTQNELADRAAEKAPHALRIAVDNFLNSPKYEEIIMNLKLRDQVEPNKPAASQSTVKYESQAVSPIESIDFTKVKQIIFIRHDQHIGTSTMALSILKDKIHSSGKKTDVDAVKIQDIEDVNTTLAIVTKDALSNVLARYSDIQILVVDDLINTSVYDELVEKLQ